MERTEELTTKLRTLSYDHERLMSMHRTAMERAANAERETNLHKSRLTYVIDYHFLPNYSLIHHTARPFARFKLQNTHISKQPQSFSEHGRTYRECEQQRKPN